MPRLRITADGHLKVCLFGADNLHLLRILRAGGEEAQPGGLARLIKEAVMQKKPALGGFGAAGNGGYNHRLVDSAEANRPMILIGG